MKKIASLLVQLLLPFFVISQNLNYVSPDNANAGQTLDVYIIGNNTHFTKDSSIFVSFFSYQAFQDSIYVNSVNAIDDTTLIANISIPANGHTADFSIAMYGSFDGYLSVDTAFHVNGLAMPSLVSVSPASSTSGQTLDVTITGTNTHFTQASSTIDFNSLPAAAIINSINVIDDNTIIANITVPASTYAGYYTVGLYNAIDGYQSLYNSLFISGVVPPFLVSVNPASANSGQTLNVTITGSNTHFAQASSTEVGFYFGSGVVNSLNVLDDDHLLANITVPAYVYTGNYGVWVNNSIDGFLYLDSALHVDMKMPELVSISPSSARDGQTLIVTIKGVNTHFMQASGTLVDFSFHTSMGTVVNAINIIDDQTIKAKITVPSNTYTGYYDVRVYNSIDGYLELANGFYVNGAKRPTIDIVKPGNAKAGQTLDVTITGANTHFAQASGTMVDFSFYQASGTTVVNRIKIINDKKIIVNITVPANTYTGNYSVYVYNSVDGFMAKESAFYVKGVEPPSISLSPASASSGQTLNVTITGANTHFAQASGTLVDFNFYQASGTTVNGFTIIDDHTIIANITVPANTPAGNYYVLVYNPIDGYLFSNFNVVSNNCYSYFTTNYDSDNNKFELTIDSTATMPGNSYYWNFGDGTYSTDATPNHIFGENGYYNVCLTITTASGTDSCIYCRVIGKDSLGIVLKNGGGFSMEVKRSGETKIAATDANEKISNDEIPSFSVYPNPADDLIHVATKSLASLNEPILSLYSIDGRLLLQQSVVQDNTVLKLNELATGIYILKMTSNEKSEVIRFVKQ